MNIGTISKAKKMIYKCIFYDSNNRKKSLVHHNMIFWFLVSSIEWDENTRYNKLNPGSSAKIKNSNLFKKLYLESNLEKMKFKIVQNYTSKPGFISSNPNYEPTRTKNPLANPIVDRNKVARSSFKHLYNCFGC